MQKKKKNQDCNLLTACYSSLQNSSEINVNIVYVINYSLHISIERRFHFYLTCGLYGLQLLFFLIVLNVILDITHWDRIMLFVGIVSVINSKSDLCVS